MTFIIVALTSMQLTSMRRHDVASTLMRRYINVMCPLGDIFMYLYGKCVVSVKGGEEGAGLRPFQKYFTYIEPIVHQRWAKTGEPGEKPPDHP